MRKHKHKKKMKDTTFVIKGQWTEKIRYVKSHICRKIDDKNNVGNPKWYQIIKIQVKIL